MPRRIFFHLGLCFKLLSLFSFSNISSYHSELQAASFTCVEAVEFYLENIRKQQHLNAFVHVFEAESLERAQQLDCRRGNKEATGRLHGVVIAIKDVICYKDHTVTAASGILKGFKSLFNATVVQRLLDEDAIIIGICNCDEFAMGSTNENSVYGATKNALNETKVPGGSSGGSAVAVQAGMCMVSLGSDTGGSVRQPADFCGIIGLKPSYGTISRHGLIAYASSFDQIGIFGKNVDDLRHILSVINGMDDHDSTVAQFPARVFPSSPAKKTIRFASFQNAIGHSSLDPEIAEGIKDIAKKLVQAGHKLNNIDFGLIDFIVPTYYILSTAEASSNLSRYDGVRYGYRSTSGNKDLATFYKKSRSEGFGKEVKRRIMLGTFVLSEGYYDAYFTKAQQVRNILKQQTEKIFSANDIIIMPTVPTTAFTQGAAAGDPVSIYLADIYTVYANLTGIPAISVPLFKHSNGMPFGLQLLSKRFDEAILLDCATMLMQNYSSN